jgi:hypothetical protein
LTAAGAVIAQPFAKLPIIGALGALRGQIAEAGRSAVAHVWHATCSTRVQVVETKDRYGRFAA